MLNTFSLAFRGEYVDTFTSVYDVQHVVLTYRTVRSTKPSVAQRYKTLASAVKAIKDDPTHLATWKGQSFIVEVFPGVNEITESNTFDAAGKQML